MMVNDSPNYARLHGVTKLEANINILTKNNICYFSFNLDYIQFNMVSTEDYFRKVMETALWVLVK